jgi:hypothetical protein
MTMSAKSIVREVCGGLDDRDIARLAVDVAGAANTVDCCDALTTFASSLYWEARSRADEILDNELCRQEALFS